MFNYMSISSVDGISRSIDNCSTQHVLQTQIRSFSFRSLQSFWVIGCNSPLELLSPRLQSATRAKKQSKAVHWIQHACSERTYPFKFLHMEKCLFKLLRNTVANAFASTTTTNDEMPLTSVVVETHHMYDFAFDVVRYMTDNTDDAGDYRVTQLDWLYYIRVPWPEPQGRFEPLDASTESESESEQLDLIPTQPDTPQLEGIGEIAAELAIVAERVSANLMIPIQCINIFLSGESRSGCTEQESFGWSPRFVSQVKDASSLECSVRHQQRVTPRQRSTFQHVTASQCSTFHRPSAL